MAISKKEEQDTSNDSLFLHLSKQTPFCVTTLSSPCATVYSGPLSHSTSLFEKKEGEKKRKGCSKQLKWKLGLG